MDDCKPTNLKHLKNRSSSYRTQATTGQISQLPDRNDPLWSQSWHNFRWTSHFFWPNIIIIQILLFSHSCTSLYPSVSWFQNCQYYATSVVHSKLDYCNLLYSNLPNSEINRLQQIQNSLARTVVKFPRFSHITPVIKSLHWLKVKERIEYKLLSLTYKVLTTSQTTYFLNWSLFSLLAVLDPPLLLSYPNHLLPHLTKIQTVLFNTQHTAFGINSLTLSVSLIHILVFRFLTTLHMSDPP